MKPIHFPPMAGRVERKSYCVTISQQKRLQAQIPGIDVPKELEQIAREFEWAASRGAAIPVTANKYWKEIISRLTADVQATAAPE
jgi:hypothetical protein